AFEAGDQRHYHVSCPSCGVEQVLEFENLKFEKTWPHKAVYACAANGCVIPHSEKRGMVAKGRWIAAEPGPGRQPSFHIDSLVSPFVTWDDIAEAFLDAEKSDEEVRQKRYSITSLQADPEHRALFCGCTNMAGHILKRFDPATGTFEDLGFSEVADANSVKIHKGLWLDEAEDALYFGVASLSPIPKLIGSGGGRLMRYDIASGRFETLGVPVAENYIQATCYDARRKLMYSFHEPSHCFAVWSIADGKLVRAHHMDSIVHVTDIDDDGGVWGTWGGNHAFFRYDPDADKMEFPDGCSLPNGRAAANIMYYGGGPVDCMINGGDWYMYIATAVCELYRL
ncbi:hypothetical protein LCGC14_3133170, partial [marine sediment metagenome]